MESAKTLKEILEYFQMYKRSFMEVVIPNCTNIFYRPNNASNKHGFSFVVVDQITWGEKPEDDLFEVVFHGEAHFDGIRHFYMGHALTDNEGYLSFPEMGDISDIMDKLAFLEKRYCTK